MAVDLLYVTHNRREFTEASLDALIANTNWDLVRTTYLIDDRSTDGTFELLDQIRHAIPVETILIQDNLGGPVAAMNAYLDRANADMFAKIDSDVVVCPEWLDVMMRTLDAHPDVDALGMEPGFGGEVRPPSVARSAVPARWIGGVGLLRSRVFARRRPVLSERFFGLTQFWRQNARCAWISPDLPVFLLDHIDAEPWRSLTRSYVEKGWSREWPPYDHRTTEAYAGWWLASDATRRMEAAGA